ncbi:MAG: ECF transporter S component [Oscillospiraceae bacterium]|nr:ECF transporter S component [Oscillospiraceae bacterium]
MKKNKSRELAYIGLMAALVFVTTNFISIKIPVGGGQTQIHVGNAMCILSGLLFGPIAGGLASGIGSMFVDLLNPAWAPEFWITFIMKFVMGFIAGLISHMGKQTKTKNLIAAILGAVGYVVCYLTKNYIKEAILLQQPWETVSAILITKGVASFTNAMIAMTVSVILFNILQPALKRANILKD